LLLQRLIWGALPVGKTLLVGPMFTAGWFGLLVTMLNLIPIGQLDGGHLSYAVLGTAASRFGKVIALLMFGLCLFYSIGWLLWLVVAGKLIGFGHPPPLESDSPLSPARKLTVAISLAALILCVMPAPIAIISVP
jgi:membrane-associated protease RseP (regulator of RpoE activity)